MSYSIFSLKPVQAGQPKPPTVCFCLLLVTRGLGFKPRSGKSYRLTQPSIATRDEFLTFLFLEASAASQTYLHPTSAYFRSEGVQGSSLGVKRVKG
ncbi:hypothetical protein BaRGS_00004049 [Batillaria attramentaria]|uniref:Uncharacterized protein n=1 Tax=Batillaria attramentaria TaxID=370345 RepID=A0ABD0LYN7_9CAEN